jgi:hypothetical protein
MPAGSYGATGEGGGLLISLRARSGTAHDPLAVLCSILHREPGLTRWPPVPELERTLDLLCHLAEVGSMARDVLVPAPSRLDRTGAGPRNAREDVYRPAHYLPLVSGDRHADLPEVRFTEHRKDCRHEPEGPHGDPLDLVEEQQVLVLQQLESDDALVVYGDARV